ncbi:hypothetical protein GCM10020221_03930 [Streptomyces thioluteus]|uniref:Uncharacterized protein n=1 Tax=Streptomyces thioluteus TaxID=66431 RepID=A0ABN3WDX7_STRTU
MRQWARPPRGVGLRSGIAVGVEDEDAGDDAVGRGDGAAELPAAGDLEAAGDALGAARGGIAPAVIMSSSGNSSRAASSARYAAKTPLSIPTMAHQAAEDVTGGRGPR